MADHPTAARDPFWSCCGGATPRDRANLRRFLRYYVGWTIAFTGGSQLIKREVVPQGPASWTIIALTALLAVLVFRSYARFLRETDEMRRAIHNEAMAIAFGVGILGVTFYRLLERVGAPAADIGDATLILALSFVIGIVRATWRYR
ncbi:hypothetical protein K8I85_19285 [bacterium]|nr:hypothetical protein [bacterium]